MTSKIVRVALMIFMATVYSAQVSAEETGRIDYQKYFQSAHVLSAVSAAAAALGECKKLDFTEKMEGSDTLVLNVSCIHDEGYRSSVIVRFNYAGDDFLTQRSVQYAG